MDPLHSSSSDNSYDYFIAFLVLLGASFFIFQQSFPDKSVPIAERSSIKEVPITEQIKPKRTYQQTTAKELSYYEQQQAERDFADTAIREWTEELEEKEIKNTSFTTPSRSIPKEVPLAAAASTIPLISTTNKNVPKKQAAPKTPTTTHSKVKDTSVFIDTAVKETGEKMQATGAAAKKAIQQAPEQVIKTYENISPTISLKKDQLVEKGMPKKAPVQKKVAKKTPVKKKASTKKKAKKEGKNCVIVIAALQDAGNIKRLVQSLKSEKYSIYNKQVGKHRSIGIKTSCNPNTYNPLLKRIKRDYSPDAWFSKR